MIKKVDIDTGVIQKVIHEAAHVVVTVALKYSAWPEMFSDPRKMVVDGIEVDDAFGETLTLTTDYKPTAPTPREQIVMTYAPIAYAVVTGQAIEVWKTELLLTIEGPPSYYFGLHDFTKINHILDGITKSKMERERIFRKCTKKARNIVSQCIEDIETIA